MGPLFPYFGGKNRLAKRIIERITPHTCYVEVFAGGAGIFFRKEPSRAEVVNDLDRDLINFYRVIKYHPEEFHKEFKYLLFARDEFERQKKILPDTQTDIQRAARYFYLQRSTFGGKVVGQTFGACTTKPPRINLFSLDQTIHEAWLRLAHATIECLDFKKLIPRYDRDHTFFFLDPPYWQIPGYHHDFKEHDFHDLSALMATIKGRFLMTINDTLEVRKIFNGFNVEEVEVRYSIREKVGRELLVANF